MLNFTYSSKEPIGTFIVLFFYSGGISLKILSKTTLSGRYGAANFTKG